MTYNVTWHTLSHDYNIPLPCQPLPVPLPPPHSRSHLTPPPQAGPTVVVPHRSPCAVGCCPWQSGWQADRWWGSREIVVRILHVLCLGQLKLRVLANTNIEVVWVCVCLRQCTCGSRWPIYMYMYMYTLWCNVDILDMIYSTSQRNFTYNVHVHVHVHVRSVTVYTVQPRLCGPRLSGTSIIQTCLTSPNALHKGQGWWPFGGVTTVDRATWLL